MASQPSTIVATSTSTSSIASTLLLAISNGDIKTAEDTIAPLGLVPNLNIEGGNTLVHYALLHGQTDMALWLIEKIDNDRSKDDVAAKTCLEALNDDRKSPLDIAASISEKGRTGPNWRFIIRSFCYIVARKKKGLEGTQSKAEHQMHATVEIMKSWISKFISSCKQNNIYIDYRLLAEEINPKFWVDFAEATLSKKYSDLDLIQNKITQEEYEQFLADRKFLNELISNKQLIRIHTRSGFTFMLPKLSDTGKMLEKETKEQKIIRLLWGLKLALESESFEDAMTNFCELTKPFTSVAEAVQLRQGLGSLADLVFKIAMMAKAQSSHYFRATAFLKDIPSQYSLKIALKSALNSKNVFLATLIFYEIADPEITITKLARILSRTNSIDALLTEAAIYFAEKWQGQFQKNPLSGGKAPKTEKTSTIDSQSQLQLKFSDIKKSDIKKLSEDLKGITGNLPIEKRFELICKVHSKTTKLIEILKVMKTVATGNAFKQHLEFMLMMANWKRDRMNKMHQGGKWKPKAKDLSIMDFENYGGSEKGSSDQIQKLHSESESDASSSDTPSSDTIQANPKRARKLDSKSENAADSLDLPDSKSSNSMDSSSDSKSEKEKNEEGGEQQAKNKAVSELCNEIDKIFEEPDFEENFKRYFAKILEDSKAPEKLEKIGDEKEVLNLLFVAAVKRNRVAIAEFLLNQGADIWFSHEHHGFGNCRVYEDDPEIRFALGPYYDHDKTALWHACEFGSLQMVELLLDEKWGASCNFGNTKHFGIFMIRDNAFTVAALNKKLDLWISCIDIGEKTTVKKEGIGHWLQEYQAT